ncbi:MAG: hypothetical protein ABWX74_20360 [Aeromicrobium sp.]
MLRRARPALQTVMSLVGVLAAVLVLLVATSPSASAENGCPSGQTRNYIGNGKYTACRPIEGTTPPVTNPGPGPGPVAPPPCPLDDFPESYHADKPGRTGNFCINEDVCYTTNVFPPIRLPDGDRPNEDSKPRVTFCFIGPDASNIRDIFWSDEEEPPTLLEQAQTAIGQIVLPTPTINTSPTTRTLVNLDTWVWIDGAQQRATGSSAFGLVAIATFRGMTVDPGDGTGPFPCPYVTDSASAERDCAHTYTRASVRGSQSVDGRPAYGITVNTTYDLTFEVDGAPVTIDGAPLTLDGPPAQAALRVDEVQSIVKRG